VSRTPSDRISGGRFPTTHWSRVIAAGDPNAPLAREALTSLCGAYWYPLYAYIRRKGYSPEQAQDLTQDLFAYALERNLFAKADPDRGRFRSFLRTVCDRCIAGQRDRQHARKRGGGTPVLSIDAVSAEGRYSLEPAHELTPERIFDRSWALTLLGRVLDQLRREYDEAGNAATFEELHVVLTGGPESTPYGTIALRRGTNEGAVRVAVHRLRRRYGMLLRREIAATVDDPAEIDDEIRALFTALES
jgi:DNA-directed RNA polymerase specialized sigma24 family protein